MHAFCAIYVISLHACLYRHVFVHMLHGTYPYRPVMQPYSSVPPSERYAGIHWTLHISPLLSNPRGWLQPLTAVGPAPDGSWYSHGPGTQRIVAVESTPPEHEYESSPAVTVHPLLHPTEHLSPSCSAVPARQLCGMCASGTCVAKYVDAMGTMDACVPMGACVPWVDACVPAMHGACVHGCVYAGLSAYMSARACVRARKGVCAHARLLASKPFKPSPNAAGSSQASPTPPPHNHACACTRACTQTCVHASVYNHAGTRCVPAHTCAHVLAPAYSFVQTRMCACKRIHTRGSAHRRAMTCCYYMCTPAHTRAAADSTPRTEQWYDRLVASISTNFARHAT